MKHFTIVSYFCLILFIYAASIGKDLDALIERAEQLITESNKLVKDHKESEHGLLVSDLESDVERLQNTLAELKQYNGNHTVRSKELDFIEESHLTYANHVQEKLDFAKEVYEAHTSKTANELIEYGQLLVNIGKDKLAKHQTGRISESDVKTLEMEIKSVENIIKGMKESPDKTKLWQEQLLVQKEQNIRELLIQIEQP